MANIGKSIQIKGDLTGNEDLVIEGVVEGRVDLPNNQLTVGAEGKIQAAISAKTVVVIGHVTGDVSAVERIEVQASGIIDGDVIYLTTASRYVACVNKANGEALWRIAGRTRG